MGYFTEKHTFFGETEYFEHRAKRGTANSTSSDRGADKKLNNTPEYNHKYYEQHKDKWAKEGKYDPNGDDEDFKKVYGNDLKNPKLNMDTHIKGTDFYSTTNKDGQIVLINGNKKWTLPKGVKLTDEMKQALASIDSHHGNHDNDFLGKMAKFLDEASKKQPGEKSSAKSTSKKASEEKKEEAPSSKTTSGSGKSFEEHKTNYYTEKDKSDEEAKKRAKSSVEKSQKQGKQKTLTLKRKTVYKNVRV